ncbi:MAG TPA: MazG nucleotide pyrophosphohydrolase domain-containing protein, partial [Streptosporangiaceae bacterium]|nr:MazG nucleotide pyrophosphohydrolase domain-containing protein [Streptosporangiaceae bacterium]
LLQVVFHARIASDFDIDDVADQIVDKLVRRHPHVFGSVTVADADEVKRNWDEIKKQERSRRRVARAPDAEPADEASVLDGVPFGQPALALAAQLQRRAARAGVPESLTGLADAEGVVSPGVADAVSPGASADLGAELFRLVALARAAGIDPELELRAVARRYRDLVRAWERAHR